VQNVNVFKKISKQKSHSAVVLSGSHHWMRLFDSVSKSVVCLPNKPVLSWYSCGPTVYDQTHLGHARNYVSIDILQRAVEAVSSSRVFHVMGITDVDDKILQRASLLNVAPSSLAHQFEAEFVESMRALRVRPPVTMTRVTEHIGEIVAYVEQIVASGLATVKPGDGVYFDTAKLGAEKYHLLGGKNGGVSEEDGFVLWKNRDRGVEGLGWESSFGYGRPGWHIECSAMIESALGAGQKLDVHAGGIDLRFHVFLCFVCSFVVSFV
jgi:cysteinyl-tRNA synthetase